MYNVDMTFGDKIKKILRDNGYSYKVKVFPRKENYFSKKKGKTITQDYDKVVIYAGRNIEKYASKRSKKLVAWKNEKGEWEGDLQIVKEQGGKGSAIYLMDYNDKTEPLKKVLFSDLWEENEKKFGGQEQELLKMMESWKFTETERAKLDEEEAVARRKEMDEERIQGELNKEVIL